MFWLTGYFHSLESTLTHSSKVPETELLGTVPLHQICSEVECAGFASIFFSRPSKAKQTRSVQLPFACSKEKNDQFFHFFTFISLSIFRFSSKRKETEMILLLFASIFSFNFSSNFFRFHFQDEFKGSVSPDNQVRFF
jgi:hypothetical protein